MVRGRQPDLDSGACYDNGRLSSFPSTDYIFHQTTATALDSTNHWRYTQEHTSITGKLHSGRCYPKIRGNGFRLLTKTKISLASLVAIANPDARRPTSIRYQFFSSTFPISRCACAISLPFFLFLFLYFSFLFYRSPRRLFLTHAFWRRGTEGISMEGKLDLRLYAFASIVHPPWVCFGAKLVSRCL